MLIYYSGEIRFYSLSLLFSVLSVIFFINLQKNQSKFNTYSFTIFTLISLLVNVYSLSLILSYFIFNFFLKKTKIIYLLLIIILFLFFVLNFQYLFSINEIYSSSGSRGNINLKFFLGYFFNIYFSNIILGGICLILFAFSIFYLKNEIFKNEKLFLFYTLIFFTYLIPIILFLFGKNITYPRHLIFLVPFIVYILSYLLISLKSNARKSILILIICGLSIYANLFSQKPFMVKKPNPNGVLKIFNNQSIKKLLIHGVPKDAIYSDIIEKKKIFCSRKGCDYANLVFLYSSSFNSDQTEILLQNDYLNENKFWSICIHLPSYRGDNTKENELKNCYRSLDHIEKTHYQAANYIKNEFKLTLYKSR